jgi:hypothetical protein
MAKNVKGIYLIPHSAEHAGYPLPVDEHRCQ